MVAFPTIEWLEEYHQKVNESTEYKTAGKGWGVDWNGDFIFQIDELPLDKVDQLPDSELKETLKKTLAEYADGATVYAHIGLKDGACTAAKLVKDPNSVETGFKLIGTYENWKKLAKAQTDATKLVLTRKMALEGKMTLVMKYIKGVQILGKVASEVPTEFVDEMV